MRAFILLAFFLSGACALVYEVIWTRLLGLVMGNTVYAVSTTLATFMAGPVPITISVIAGATAGADLSFGYDTFGIRKALASGNGFDVLDGFFIGDHDRYGFDKDELYINAYAGLEGAVDLLLMHPLFIPCASGFPNSVYSTERLSICPSPSVS